jgi:hypothetical protein
LTGPRDGAGISTVQADTDHDREGLIMADPESQDPQALADALTAISDAVEYCRPLLIDIDPAPIAAMLDTATATSEITVILLQQSVPPADDEEPGTAEALELATDLAADARRHLVTGLHLMAGARAITTNVSENR